MRIDATATLAEVVGTWPAAIPVLERLSIDYCCGGGRRLDEAVAAAGLDVQAVLDELTALDGAPTAADTSWSSYGMVEMVDHLEATHHQWLRAALARLDALAVKVEGVHAERHAELHAVRVLVGDLRADLEPHLVKEERVLFPMIRELAEATGGVPSSHCGTLRNPIGVMNAEHDRVGDLLAELRSTTAEYAVPDGACASYRSLYEGLAELEADTHLHVHKENNLLFPAVIAAEQRLADSRRD